MNNIIFSNNLNEDLASFIKKYRKNKIFILLDENTYKHCYPLVQDVFLEQPFIEILPAGEKSKNIEFVEHVWRNLTENKADRQSLLINIGGGKVTDLGGFVAGTFQRGIDYVNIPTSLLAQIDASVGGKTGVNFNDLKNQIGLFNEASAILIASEFLKTLPQRELISGLAEMVKHSLLDKQEAWDKINKLYPERIDFAYLQTLIKESIEFKMKIVESDPLEKGNREALNFGHTIGHAIETSFNKKNINILHGEAVAIGMICELFLSNKVFSFNFMKLFEVSQFLATYFKSFKIKYSDYEEIYEIMKHDKKNKEDSIRFTLLRDIGKFETNQQCSKEDIFESLNFYFQIQK
ncbi:MAG: 3-dehydroquinate synthase [Bacteroidota bacterium]|nr:3-dehydroquinate synthase [Bacteroidota bacterium]